MRRHFKLIFIILILTGVGSSALLYSSSIIYELRVERFINCFTAGSALALAGLIIQNISRNSLSDPYLIGIAPASILGYTVGILFNHRSNSISLLFSVLFCFTLLFFILIKKINGLTMVVLGIAGGSLCIALNNILLLLFPRQAITNQLLSNIFSHLDYPTNHVGIYILTICFLISFGYDTFLKTQFDLNSLDIKNYYSLGISLFHLNIISTFLVALIVALTTITYGIIGFIGFAIPNLFRSYGGYNIRFSHTFILLLGGLTLTSADGFGRLLSPPYGIPANLLCAIVGAPFLIYFVAKNNIVTKN